MPKRVLDFDALWSSDKLAACAPWAQAEYAWLYGLADCNGCFELTNLRVIWGRVAAIRHALTLERLEQIFDEFIAHGLLFTWESGGKRYGHWTGSDQPGRLPPPSWRARLERLTPAVPRAELAGFVARFSQSNIPQREVSRQSSVLAREENRGVRENGSHASASPTCAGGLKPGSSHCLEAAQAQGLDLGLDKGREEEVEWELVPISNSSPPVGKTSSTFLSDMSSETNAASSESSRIERGITASSATEITHSSAIPRAGSACPRDDNSKTGQTQKGQTGTFTRRFVPNRSPLPEARVGVSPVVTTGRIRRDALERILKREAARHAIPP